MIKKFLTTFFFVFGSIFFIPPKQVQAIISINIDEQTLTRGYTMQLQEFSSSIRFEPESAKKPFRVEVKNVALPKKRIHANPLLPIFEYDIESLEIQDLQKPITITFTLPNIQSSSEKTILYWDQSKKQWVKVPTIINGQTASASLPFSYAIVGFFEFDLPETRVIIASEDEKDFKIKTKRNDFIVRLSSGMFENKTGSVVLQTDPDPAFHYPIPSSFRRTSPFFSYDVDGLNKTLGDQTIEVVIKNIEPTAYLQEIYFWDDRMGQWRNLPSEIDVGKSTIRGRANLSFSHISVFEDASKRSLGFASWYRSKKFPYGAASNDYPFDTKLVVTNPDTLESVIATVVSTGPFVNDRIIDLAFDAFQSIAHPYRDGVVQVYVEPL